MASIGEIEQEILRIYQDLINKGEPPGAGTLGKAKKIFGGGGGGIIGRVLGAVSGGAGDFFRNIKYAMLGMLLIGEAENIIQRLITERRLDLNPVPQWAEPAVRGAVQLGEEAIGAPIFDWLIRTPLGLELSNAPGAEGSEAVRVIERLFGFATALDFGTATAEDFLKGPMGVNAPVGLVEAIKRLPMNVGVNWAIGFMLSQFMWEAYMPPLVQQAMRQTRPTRLAAPDLIRGFYNGSLSAKQVNDGLADLGIRDSDFGAVYESGRPLMSINDMAAAYLFGLRSEEDFRVYLKRQGLAQSDIDLTVDLYLKRAETAGGDQLRAVAQKGYLDGHLTEEQYKSYLGLANVPDKSIELELTAARLVKEWGRVTLNVSQIRTLLENGSINDAQAQQRLEQNGYPEVDATALIKEWHFEKEQGHPGLTEAKIMAYLRGGVLDVGAAYDLLIQRGVRSSDALFMVQHPETKAGTKSHELSQDTILSAMVEGVITQSKAEELLHGLGLTDEQITIVIRSANLKANRGPKPKKPEQSLTTAQILDAMTLELATPAWAIRELVMAGHTEENAMLLVQIAQSRVSHSIPADWSTLV